MTSESSGDPILRTVEAALLAVTTGDLDLARGHLAALDLDYARELRRSKVAAVAGAVRVAARSPGVPLYASSSSRCSRMRQTMLSA